MYYQNYDDYMRDVFYFNQMPMANQNMGFQSFGYNQMNPGMQAQNYNNMYPSVYRIIQPVVSRIVSGNNCQYLTEEGLTAMVDNVYNIVEGDVISNTENDTQACNSSQGRTAQSQTSQTQNNSTTRNQENNNSQNATVLLKDLIRILIIKELINRCNMRRMPNLGMCPNQFCSNCYEQRYV